MFHCNSGVNLQQSVLNTEVSLFQGCPLRARGFYLCFFFFYLPSLQILRNWLHKARRHRRKQAKSGHAQRRHEDRGLQTGESQHIRLGDSGQTLTGEHLRQKQRSLRELDKQNRPHEGATTTKGHPGKGRVHQPAHPAPP